MAILAQLFERHSSAIYYVCYRYLEDAEQSKDAVMQIFEELIQKVNRQEIRQFNNWLYVLARNYCLMQLRAAKKIQQVPIEEVVEFPVDLHPDNGDKEAQLKVLDERSK